MKKIRFMALSMALAACLPVLGQEAGAVRVPDKIEAEARPFAPTQLRLLDGSPFKNAMDRDRDWLLSLSPDRLLHRFRLNAGLEPKAPIYGGWESMGVSGHTLGHYLSACALYYAYTGDLRFKERVDYVVSQLAVCQEVRATGYVGGIPDEDRIWAQVSAGDIRSAGFDLNGGWVPWYTLHKLWAGLIDAYRHAGCTQALDVVTRLSDWAVNTFAHLTDEQFQLMLRSEFGGMNESLAEVYALTGNPAYLDLARRFYHRAVLDPLKARRDELEGKHSNTQVPKIIGQARLYELTADEADHTIATFYWDRMVCHHSYANGGNSDHEHLGKPDQLNDRLSTATAETCNTYNLLKLTRHLFCWQADARYMDYYERALYNHILASQHSRTGMVCYFLPMLPGSERVYSKPDSDFWCCVGSGLENHVKYAESVFFRSEADGGLFVNLFIPTELQWAERGMRVRLQTDFPQSGRVSLSFEGRAQKFPLHIRCPQWARGMTLTVDGRRQRVEARPGSYVVLERKWGPDTVLDIDLTMDLYTVAMPDNDRRQAVFFGPVMLAAPLGTGELQPFDLPCFVSRDAGIVSAIRPDGARPLAFTARTTASEAQPLLPLYEVHDQKFAVYFDVFTPAEWQAKADEYRRLIAERKALDARTTDLFRIGEMQPERDHRLEAHNSTTGRADGCAYRDARDGWFAFDATVDPQADMQMMCAYWGADKDQRTFDILVDGQLLRTVSLKGEHGPKVFHETYDIPRALTQGKQTVRVCFRSHPGQFAGGLFGFRMLRR